MNDYSKSSCEMRVDSASGGARPTGPEASCRTASAAHSARLSTLESLEQSVAADELQSKLRLLPLHSLPPLVSQRPATATAECDCHRVRSAACARSDCARRSTERSTPTSRSRAALRNASSDCAVHMQSSRRSASDRAARAPSAQCAGKAENAIDSRRKWTSKTLNERSGNERDDSKYSTLLYSQQTQERLKEKKVEERIPKKTSETRRNERNCNSRRISRPISMILLRIADFKQNEWNEVAVKFERCAIIREQRILFTKFKRFGNHEFYTTVQSNICAYAYERKFTQLLTGSGVQ